MAETKERVRSRSSLEGGEGQLLSYQERAPHPSEEEYFKANPNVAGMAAEDDRIVMNPYSKLSDPEKSAVRRNEAARIFMRRHMQPDFELTEEQKRDFGGYSSNENDVKATIAARLLSGDPSAGKATPEQRAFVRRLQISMQAKGGAGGEPGAPQLAMGRDAILGEISRRREQMEARNMAESRIRHDQILDQILELMELNKQDESDAMEGERQRDVVMQEHKRDIADQLEQEWSFRQAEIERETALPTFDASIEEQAQIRASLKEAQAQERAAIDAILEQVTSGESYKLQNMKERGMVREAWKRQDEILAEVQKRRAAGAANRRVVRQRQAKPAAPAPEFTEKNLLEQIRRVRSRELLAGRLSNQAADSRDKAAWERAGKIIDKLYDEREALFDRLRTMSGRERADQVYDELYIKGR